MAKNQARIHTAVDTHPSPSLRNVFYLLWMILLGAAFSGTFIGLALLFKGGEHFAYGAIILALSLLLNAVGLLTGVLFPIQKAKRYQGKKRR